MQINGYQIRMALKSAELCRETLVTQFRESLFKFESESKRASQDIAADIKKIEDSITKLQFTQSQYNLGVKIAVANKDPMTLCEAVKALGGAVRMLNLWKSVAPSKKNRPGYYAEEPVPVRRADEVRAMRTVGSATVLENVLAAEKWVAALRAGIASCNAASMDMDIDPQLLL